MVEYEVGHSIVSQVLSQDCVNPAALFTRDFYFSCLRVFADLVFVVITLLRCELVAEQINSQCFEALFSMLCSSAGTSSAGGSVLVDFSAPFDKRGVFTLAVFSATHDVEHFLM